MIIRTVVHKVLESRGYVYIYTYVSAGSLYDVGQLLSIHRNGSNNSVDFKDVPTLKTTPPNGFARSKFPLEPA